MMTTEKCKICKKEYSTDCDYNQGRCPERKPMIDIQPKDTSRGHFYVSMIKSVLRIIAGAAFAGTAFGWGSVFAGGCLLMIAEVLGIVEEVV
jgi:hypothetical protein